MTCRDRRNCPLTNDLGRTIMDLRQIRRLKPKLTQFLRRFDDCFPRKDTRAHLPVYITGQLSDLPQKSVEPIALEADVAPRTLQEFLSQHHWDHDRMRDRLQEIVRDEHAGPHAIGILDETSDVKKGDKTPGVKRQHCGAVGKLENCIVTVHVALPFLLIVRKVMSAGSGVPRHGTGSAGTPDPRESPSTPRLRGHRVRRGPAERSCSTSSTSTSPTGTRPG